jgi:transposase
MPGRVDRRRTRHARARRDDEGTVRPKIPQLLEALTGNFGEHHAFLCRAAPATHRPVVRTDPGVVIAGWGADATVSRQLDQLETIPGVGQSVAEVIVAETGANMSRFRTAGHLASWAGICPGHHESAGKRKSGKTRHGNRWLRGALGTAAMAATRTKDNT